MPSPHSSFGSMQDLRTGGCCFNLGSANIFSRIDDSQCEKIHSSLITTHYFNYGYVGKQLVAWKEYCAE